MEKDFIVKDKDTFFRFYRKKKENPLRPPPFPLPRRKQLLQRPTTESASNLQTKQQATTF